MVRLSNRYGGFLHVYLPVQSNGVIWSASICFGDPCQRAKDGAKCCVPVACDGCEGGCDYAVPDRPSCPFSLDWIVGAI